MRLSSKKCFRGSRAFERWRPLRDRIYITLFLYLAKDG